MRRPVRGGSADSGNRARPLNFQARMFLAPARRSLPRAVVRLAAVSRLGMLSVRLFETPRSRVSSARFLGQSRSREVYLIVVGCQCKVAPFFSGVHAFIDVFSKLRKCYRRASAGRSKLADCRHPAGLPECPICARKSRPRVVATHGRRASCGRGNTRGTRDSISAKRSRRRFQREAMRPAITAPIAVAPIDMRSSLPLLSRIRARSKIASIWASLKRLFIVSGSAPPGAGARA